MTAREPRFRHPKQLDAGTFQAEISSFALRLAAEGKAAKTIRTYPEAVPWFAAARLPGQAQAGIFRAGGRDIRPRDRVEEHQEAPVRERLLDHFLFYREPPVHSGTRTGVSRTDHAQAPPL